MVDTFFMEKCRNESSLFAFGVVYLKNYIIQNIENNRKIYFVVFSAKIYLFANIKCGERLFKTARPREAGYKFPGFA